MTENTAQSLLDSLTSPKQVMDLSDEQLPVLAAELRKRIIDVVSKNGGHLAPSLGVVELTLALLHTFNMEQDKIVWDVGHQAYAYKLLTGRASQFHTLRTLGGLAGFPRRSESPYDRFGVGHSSTSISAALGMAMARDLAGGKEHVLAVIGDGSLTAGEAFEGLNLAGHMGRRLIVVLNDNEISISPNVGALSLFLSRTLSRRWVRQTRKDVLQLLRSIPRIGQKLALYAMRGEWSFKSFFTPGMLFEAFRFTYIGPVDGHDLPALCRHLQMAAAVEDGPVLLHVHTVKGKGYPFAQKEPGQFHGVAPFDVKTGRALKPSGENFSHVFGQELLSLAREDERICAVTAAMVEGTGLTDFSRTLPRRFFDVGIAEGHAVAMCAGMAQQGMVPVFAVYSSFLQRGYDMLLHDVALNHLHVVLGVDRAGLVGADGETHHGCFDPMYLSQVPGMTVLCPASFAELRRMLHRAVEEIDGPVAMRYPRGGQGRYQDDGGDGTFVCLREGNDAAILTYGILVNQALDAAELLAQKGIRVRVVKLNQICPLDSKQVKDALSGTERLLVLEDCMATGCVGQRIAAILAQERMEPRCLTLKNLGGRFAPQGTVDQLYKAFGLDARSVAHSVEEMLHEQ